MPLKVKRVILYLDKSKFCSCSIHSNLYNWVVHISTKLYKECLLKVFVCLCVVVSNTYCVVFLFCFFFILLPVSLDCPFVIASSIFSKVYSITCMGYSWYIICSSGHIISHSWIRKARVIYIRSHGMWLYIPCVTPK